MIKLTQEVRFRVAADEQTRCLANRLRHDVYLQCKYIEEACPGGIIADPKNETSWYFVAENGIQPPVIGTVRLTPILHAKDIFDLWQHDMLNSECERIAAEILKSNSVEVGSFAIQKGIPKGTVSWGLYRMMYQFSLSHGIPYWAFAVDRIANRAVRMAGWKVIQIGKTKNYLGSPSDLCYMDLAEQPEHVRDKNPKFYAYITTP